MGTIKEDIRKWFEEGVRSNQDYMIVVCDTFDWEDYPVYATTKQINGQIRHYREASMQKVMEVYNLHQDMEEQLNEHRCYRAP